MNKHTYLSIQTTASNLSDKSEKDTGRLIHLLQQIKEYPDVGIGWREGEWIVTSYFDHGIVGEAKIIGKDRLLNIALKQAIYKQ